MKRTAASHLTTVRRRPDRPSVDVVRRRISRKLGRDAKGKYVAVDPESGAYAVADDLQALVTLLTGKRKLRSPANVQIFRLGYPAAIELRRLR